MKYLNRCVMILLSFGFLLILSGGIFAEVPMTEEEQAITEATAMVVNEANNTITYINPDETNDENVNVYEKFNDVPENAWYERYLSHLVQLGIIRGINDDTFAPDSCVTRAQFATMLAYASNVDLTSYQGVTSFRDVAASAWYAPQVEWAYQKGLIKGREDGLFYPESSITREEAAVLIDRYAVSEDSGVLEEYQYELDDNAGEYLSDEEIALLKGLLAAPVYGDEDYISDWASDDVDEVSVAGLVSGDQNGDFNPTAPLKRSECVKIISAYIINDTKPTFYFPGGGYIEYLGDDATVTAGQENTIEVEQQTETPAYEFCGYGDPPDLDALLGKTDDSGITVSWARISHCSMTDMAFQKLAIDRPYITNKMKNGSEVTQYYYLDLADNYQIKLLNGAQGTMIFSYYTDSLENQDQTWRGHFYNPDTGRGLSLLYPSQNAYQYFNDHFYSAYTNYLNGDKYGAYSQLGMSIHYLEDLNSPYHAKPHPTTQNDNSHHRYEYWVTEHIGVPSILNEDITSSYRYVYDSTFIAMSNSFAGLAKSSFDTCALFESGNSSNVTAATNATITNMTRTERAVAGLLNRFYYYGWLNH